MVKLEQNIDGFEVKDTGIKQTILGAVDTIYEKLEKKGINFTLEPFEDRVLYHNRKWTEEVFVNLLENAVKYTEAGGTNRDIQTILSESRSREYGRLRYWTVSF